MQPQCLARLCVAVDGCSTGDRYRHQIEWTILDALDALSPQFDLPQTVLELTAWCADARLTDIAVLP
jgi:hypothetical protein